MKVQFEKLEVRWRGTPKRLWSRLDVIDYGDDPRELRRSMQGATLVGIDPGEPTGVACFPYDSGYPITLHTVATEDLADAVGISTGYDVVCETPLHGAVRVYDPNPWKVRGFFELTMQQSNRSEHEFVAAHTGWLKAGDAVAHVKHIDHDHRHGHDALRYAALGVTIHPRLREVQAEHLGEEND